MDGDHLYWGQGFRGYGESAFEIGSDNPNVAPWDPANHHSNIKLQTSVNGSWSLQTGSVNMYNKVKQGGTEIRDGLYESDWMLQYNYDWMARPL
jgi:hypothetical protein